MSSARGTRSAALTYDRAAPAPVVLISGKEDALASRAADQVRALLKTAHADLAVHDCAADTASPGELLTLASPSLFGEPRLIRVSAAERASRAFVEELSQVARLLDGVTYIVLRHSDTARGKDLLAAARSVPGMLEINCVQPKNLREKQQLLHSEATRLNAQLAPDAASGLLQAYSGDLGELFAVLDQLAVSTGGRITAQAVQEITAGRVETNAFAVVDAVLAGNTAVALTQLRHALATGAQPLALLGAIGKSVRDMARVYGRRGPAAQLAGELGMPPWMAEKAQRNAARWQELQLAQMIELIAATDLALKGEGKDPEYALEHLVVTLARRGR